MTRSPANPRPVTDGPVPLQQAAVAAPGPRARRGRDGSRWRSGGASGRPPPVTAPRRILIVQLDHLGDSVLTSPLIARLRAAYPEAAIDVLASPSNHEVFEADPAVEPGLGRRADLVRAPPRPLGTAAAVWELGRSIRGEGLRPGDRRPGRRAHGPGAGPGRHSATRGLGDGRRRVPADRHRRVGPRPPRGPLAAGAAGAAGDHHRRAGPGARSRRRSRPGDRRALAGRGLAPEAGPPASRRPPPSSPGVAPTIIASTAPAVGPAPEHAPDDADWLHAGRFGRYPPLLAVHVGAGTAAKRWPRRHWNTLIERFLEDGWRVIVVGGPDDPARGRGPPRPRAAPRLDRAAERHPDHGAPGAGRPVHRRRFGPGPPGGLGGNALGDPLQRHQPARPVAALVASFADPPPPRPLPALPPEGLPPGRSPLHVRPGPRPRLSRRPALVGPRPSRRVAAQPDLILTDPRSEDEPMLPDLDSEPASTTRPARLAHGRLGSLVVVGLRPGRPGAPLPAASGLDETHLVRPARSLIAQKAEARMDDDLISVIDVAPQHGRHKATVFKVLKRLNIKRTKRRSSSNKNQLVACITHEEFRLGIGASRFNTQESLRL